MEEADHPPKQDQLHDTNEVKDVQRLRLIKRAHQLFAHLHDAGTERDKAGNRTLHYSHYASLVLLSMFNPAMQIYQYGDVKLDSGIPIYWMWIAAFLGLAGTMLAAVVTLFARPAVPETDHSA